MLDELVNGLTIWCTHGLTVAVRVKSKNGASRNMSFLLSSSFSFRVWVAGCRLGSAAVYVC